MRVAVLPLRHHCGSDGGGEGGVKREVAGVWVGTSVKSAQKRKKRGCEGVGSAWGTVWGGGRSACLQNALGGHYV